MTAVGWNKEEKTSETEAEGKKRWNRRLYIARYGRINAGGAFQDTLPHVTTRMLVLWGLRCGRIRLWREYRWYGRGIGHFGLRRDCFEVLFCCPGRCSMAFYRLAECWMSAMASSLCQASIIILALRWKAKGEIAVSRKIAGCGRPRSGQSFLRVGF